MSPLLINRLRPHTTCNTTVPGLTLLCCLTFRDYAVPSSMFQAQHQTFREELAIKYPTFGYPLWEPGSRGRYHAVQVGDVGFIREGYFHKLFNVLHPTSASGGGPSDPSCRVPGSDELLQIRMDNHIGRSTEGYKEFISKSIRVESRGRQFDALRYFSLFWCHRFRSNTNNLGPKTMHRSHFHVPGSEAPCYLFLSQLNARTQLPFVILANLWSRISIPGLLTPRILAWESTVWKTSSWSLGATARDHGSLPHSPKARRVRRCHLELKCLAILESTSNGEMRVEGI